MATNNLQLCDCGYASSHSRTCCCKCGKPFAPPTRLDDAIGILVNISKEYQRLCDVMLTMPERRQELKAGSRFMDALENLRDELLKRKSSNDQAERPALETPLGLQPNLQKNRNGGTAGDSAGSLQRPG